MIDVTPVLLQMVTDVMYIAAFPLSVYISLFCMKFIRRGL